MKIITDICRLLVGLSLIPLSGCVEMATWHLNCDAKGDFEMLPPDGYQRGVSYELQHDVFLMCSENGKAKREGFLVAPTSLKGGSPRIHSSPRTVDEWVAKDGDMSRWDGSWAKKYRLDDYEAILGVVKRGTRIRMEYMRTRKTISVWFGRTSYKTPIGIIEAGTYEGWTVDMADISRWYPEKHVDSRLLKMISSD